MVHDAQLAAHACESFFAPRQSAREFAWQHSPIDPHIRPLVNALNEQRGISTWASCEGHLIWGSDGDFMGGSAPYIAFESGPLFASLLTDVLCRLSLSVAPLNYHWELRAGHMEDGRLMYRLAPIHLGIWGWSRTRFNADFARLCRVVNELGNAVLAHHPATAGRAG